MKKNFGALLLSAIFLTGFFILPALANESITAAPAVSSDSSGAFGLTLLKSGELRVKAGKVFTTGYDEGFSLPHVISYPKSLRYPAWAIRQGWEGTTVLALEILPNGKVGRTMVMKSAGKNILDKAALKAVAGWTFQPAMKNGEPVVSCIQVPVSFELQ